MDAMSPGEVAVATRSLVCEQTEALGKLLWYLVHAERMMSGLRTKAIKVYSASTMPIMRYRTTEFGREVGRNEADWWINRRETDLAAFSQRARHALAAAQTLKERSQQLKRLPVEKYKELVEQVRTFAEEHSDAITRVLEFAEWLHSRDPLAPAVLFNYKVWGSTRMADRIVQLTQKAGSPEEETDEVLATLTETAWGFQSRGLHAYVRSAFDAAADLYDDPSKSALPLPALAVVRRTAYEVTSECATFFEFLRNSLRDIQTELAGRAQREERLTSELFWRNFIEKARRSKKAESLTWDFKQSLPFWHVPPGDARRLEKAKVAADLAGFANAEGGCLVVGITDDRRVVGVSEKLGELEQLLKWTHQAIRDHFRYPRDICRILQVCVPDDNGREKVCFVLAVAKACEAAAATDGLGSYTYPQRTGSGFIKADREALQRAREHTKSDTYEFLNELDQLLP